MGNTKIEQTIEQLDVNFINMRKMIPTVWEYQDTHCAHQLNKDLVFALKMEHEQVVVADGKFIKIVYHMNVQKTELKIANSILPELDPSLLAHYQALCKQFNDAVVLLHKAILNQ